MSIDYSIIIPAYYRVDLLRDFAIPSILNQTHSNFEVIVAIDYDPNNEIFDYITSLNDKRFSTLPPFKTSEILNWQDVNSGGLDQMARVDQVRRSYFFTILSHDDLLSPTFIEKRVNTIKNNPLVRYMFSNFYILKTDPKWGPGDQLESIINCDLSNPNSLSPPASCSTYFHPYVQGRLFPNANLDRITKHFKIMTNFIKNSPKEGKYPDKVFFDSVRKMYHDDQLDISSLEKEQALHYFDEVQLIKIEKSFSKDPKKATYPTREKAAQVYRDLFNKDLYSF